MVMIVIFDRGDGLVGLSFHVTSRADDLLAFVDATILASGMGQERCLTGRAHTDVGRFHGIMSSASANA